MALGVIWGDIWDEDIWDNPIWEQAGTNPPGAVSGTNYQRRHSVGLASFRRR